MVLVSVCMLEEEKSFSYISREAELVTEGNILHRQQNCFIGEVTRPGSSQWSVVSTGNMCWLLTTGTVCGDPVLDLG